MSYFHIKNKVFTKEYRIYKYLDNMNFKYIPKFYEYDKNKKILKTQKINGLSISDLYGENFENVPKHIIEKIRNIITCLYNIGIIYPDITGYNFIEDKNSHIWIVDFEDCFYINHYNIEKLHKIFKKYEHINFVNKFCFKNENRWNPYFA